MEFKGGEPVTLRLLPGDRQFRAVFVSAQGSETVLKIENPEQFAASGRQEVILSDAGGEYYAHITERTGDTITVKKMWTERREYFRVDAVFPVSLRKVEKDPSLLRSKMTAGYGVRFIDEESPDDSISPRLWKMLVDINIKLEVILEMLRLRSDGFDKTEDRKVNLSATGMRLLAEEPFSAGDTVEIKMLLPSYPPVGIHTYGVIVRADKSEKSMHDIALHFLDMDEEVREEIIRYTIQREREIIKNRRRQMGNDS